MAWVNVLAGSFITGTGHHYSDGKFRLLTKENPHAGEDIPVSQLVELSPADSRSERLFGVVRPGKSLLEWIVSPLKALTRHLPHDPRTAITFCAKFKDGRRMIATTDLTTFRSVDSSLKACLQQQHSNLIDLADAAAGDRVSRRNRQVSPLRKV